MGISWLKFFLVSPTGKISCAAAGKFPRKVLMSWLNGQEARARLQIFPRRASCERRRRRRRC
jgi:hypothetical protein